VPLPHGGSLTHRRGSDYGTNIRLEGNWYCNFNTTILDCAEVVIGDGVLFGPKCVCCLTQRRPCLTMLPQRPPVRRHAHDGRAGACRRPGACAAHHHRARLMDVSATFGFERKAKEKTRLKSTCGRATAAAMSPSWQASLSDGAALSAREWHAAPLTASAAYPPASSQWLDGDEEHS
jgi:hypothetical protein